MHQIRIMIKNTNTCHSVGDQVGVSARMDIKGVVLRRGRKVAGKRSLLVALADYLACALIGPLSRRDVRTKKIGS
ncbi:hypothetical protein ElyMa_006517300 [Elysia marginata]|uniref:Uncharacterized protein n=1 Tax=Elysia marginata TaxID=1093978 RepID=A0AAV4I5I3_9GAST|nr:hypothetical protein ElyMa_006517300 [Elysia marginata]